MQDDGAIIFIASGGDDFLCWGRSYGERPNKPINPFVIVETSYLFCELVRHTYGIICPQGMTLRMGVSLNNLKGEAFQGYMSPYRPGTLGWDFGNDIRDAPEDNFFLAFNVRTDNPPERISFMLVSAIYEWFGFSHDVIPFTSQVDGKSIIDFNEIQKNA